MNNLINKNYLTFDYTSRYISVPYYYDKNANREISGIGTQVDTTTAFVAHKVKPEDTLESLALSYYNNPMYWWMIAYFNNIQDSFVPLISRYSTLKIPSMNSVTFGKERS